ncbi:MAG: DUF4199 domain-containing protein [Saprospiraceae bacterium]
MQTSPHPTIFRYGIISGLVSFVMFIAGILSGLMDFSSMTSSLLFGLVSMAVSIAILVVGVRFHRDKELNGFITFGQAFAVTFGISMIGMLVSNIGQYFYTHFIDPLFYENMADQMATMFEKFNVPEADAEKAIEDVKNAGSLSGMLGNIVKGGVMMTIVSAIIAAILKRKPNSPFSTNQPSDEL